MKISIITVCLNCESTIEDTIRSVTSQTYKSIEYILIDGRSSDNTMVIVNKYKDHIDQIVSEKDGGIYHAINKGIKIATGEVIGILHADDFYENPEIITNVIQLFKLSGSDSVYGNLQYVSRENKNKILRNWVAGDYNRDSFKYGWMPPHPSFFVKKKAYEIYGAYSLELSLAADYEFMVRTLYKHEMSVAYLNEVLVKMRIGGKGNNSLKQRLIANREDKKAWEMNEVKPGLFTFLLKPLRKLHQFKWN